MARRQLAGRDVKIIQGHRRDAFFAKVRRRGGVPRMPDQASSGMVTATEPEESRSDFDDVSGVVKAAETNGEHEPSVLAEDQDEAEAAEQK